MVKLMEGGGGGLQRLFSAISLSVVRRINLPVEKNEDLSIHPVASRKLCELPP